MLREFILNCIRVLRVTKKPDSAEFFSIVKVSALGMALLGLIGFLVFLVRELLL